MTITAKDIEDAMKRVEAEAPPMSDDQVQKVAVLLSTKTKVCGHVA